MEILFQNQRKKKKNVGNSFNMSSATKTFKKLIEKHNKEEKMRNRKIFLNQTDEFFHSLNNAFFKEEIKETDGDYIFREIKKQNKKNQDLIYKYGINSLKKSIPFTRDPVCFDKKMLFNPLKSSDNKPIRYASFYSKNKEDKFLTLPCILKKNRKIINIRDSQKNLLMKKLVSKDSNKYIYKDSKNIEKSNNIKTESSFFNDNNYNNTYNNERYVPIKYYNFFSKTNNKLLNLNSNGNNSSTTFSFGNKSNANIRGDKTTSSFDKHEYLLTLDNLKAQIRHNQVRHKFYFNSYDYGCELSKRKYKYITNKFFN